MPTVSVVMPAYNAENYISQAFDSLISQTFSDWECVVVNDGSSDGTLEVIERYTALDSRFRFASIENTGSAKIPRDTAITMAAAEWIIALDADDYLSADVIEKLLDRQRQTDADMILLKMALFDDQTGEYFNTIPSVGFDYHQVLTGRDAMMMTIGGWQIPGNGLFRRNFWNNRTTVVGAELCHMNVDEYDTREMLAMAKIVAFADTSYNYRIRTNSITRNISPKLFETIITDRMVAELVGREFGIDSAQFRKAKSIAIDAVLGKYFMWTRYAKQFSVENRRKVDALIRTERERYSRTEILGSDISFVRKALLTLPRWMAMIPISMFVSLKKR